MTILNTKQINTTVRRLKSKLLILPLLTSLSCTNTSNERNVKNWNLEYKITTFDHCVLSIHINDRDSMLILKEPQSLSFTVGTNDSLKDKLHNVIRPILTKEPFIDTNKLYEGAKHEVLVNNKKVIQSYKTKNVSELEELIAFLSQIINFNELLDC